MKSRLTKAEQTRIRGLLLIKAGTTISKLSKKHDVSRQFAYKALSGTHASDKAKAIREDIAKQIGLTVGDIWL